VSNGHDEPLKACGQLAREHQNKLKLLLLMLRRRGVFMGLITNAVDSTKYGREEAKSQQKKNVRGIKKGYKNLEMILRFL